MPIILRNANTNSTVTMTPKATVKESTVPAAPDIVDGEHVVVANGKAKKIRKQSQYLLDMLTIDD